MSRPAVPIALKRQLFEESGFRCAIPTCRSTSILEMAHIIDRAIVQEDTFENMIVLCAICHGLFDREEKIPRKSIETYKANLGLVNGRYNDFERRMFVLWAQRGASYVISLEVGASTEINTMNLVADGLVKVIPSNEPSMRRTQNGGIVMSANLNFNDQSLPRMDYSQTKRIVGKDNYSLTDKGRTFVARYLNADSVAE